MPANKSKHRSPTPSDIDDSDTYSDDDQSINTKQSSRSSIIMHKMGDKLKSGYDKAKTVSKSSVKSINKNLTKLKVAAVKHVHNGSEYDSDNDAAANEYAKQRKGKQTHNKSNKSRKQQYSDSDEYDSDDSTTERKRQPTKRKSHHNNSHSNQSSAQSSPKKKSGFFSLFTRKISTNDSTTNSAQHSDNDDIDNPIDLTEYDGDLSYLYIGTKLTYQQHIDTTQRQKQLQQWYNIIEQHDIIPSEPTDLKQILLLRNTLLQHRDLVYNGLPGEQRMSLWQMLSGSQSMNARLESIKTYEYYIQLSNKLLDTQTIKYIKSDLSKVLNSHSKFQVKPNQIMLYNILCAICAARVEIGYVSSLSHLVAFFLLIQSTDSSDAGSVFWLVIALIDIVLPVAYYDKGLVGVRADTHMIKLLIYQRLPKLNKHLQQYNVDLSLISLKWLLCVFTLNIPLYCTVRIFDVLFLEGSNVLLSISLALYKSMQHDILRLHDTSDIMNYIDTHMKSYKHIDELLHNVLHDKTCHITRDDIIQRNTERKIMESAYVNELQFNQLQQQEKTQRKQNEANKKHKQLEETMEYLQNGIICYKIPHSGKIKQTIVKLVQITDMSDPRHGLIWCVQWESKKKKSEDTCIPLSQAMIFQGMVIYNTIL